MRGRPILLTRMITDRIGHHRYLLNLEGALWIHRYSDLQSVTKDHDQERQRVYVLLDE